MPAKKTMVQIKGILNLRKEKYAIHRCFDVELLQKSDADPLSEEI